MNEPSTFNGGCLCGAVRFQVASPTKWCAHCHCSLCRRAHGAPFVTWFGLDRSQFELVQGEDHLTWFHSTPAARRGFCSNCGSTIFFESENWPGEIHIARALMEGPIDREPEAHVFFDTHVSWIEVGDDLRRLGGPSGTESLDRN